VFSATGIRSRECLLHELDCSLRLLNKIAVLLGVYKLLDLAIAVLEIVPVIHHPLWYLFVKITSFWPNFSI